MSTERLKQSNPLFRPLRRRSSKSLSTDQGTVTQIYEQGVGGDGGCESESMPFVYFQNRGKNKRKKGSVDVLNDLSLIECRLE